MDSPKDAAYFPLDLVNESLLCFPALSFVAPGMSLSHLPNLTFLSLILTTLCLSHGC